jgi:LmbE family N-acetylglucosaminyl deacetylase
MNTVALVVAAHPDDEVLGCGGAIAKMADAGWDVHILIMAEGATSRAAKRDRTAAAHELHALGAAATTAAKTLGAKSVELLSFADNRMDGVDLLDIVKSIEQKVAQVKPTRLLTHHRGDVNIDHQRIHDAVLAAARPLPEGSIKELLFFEVASSTEWRPAVSGSPFAPAMFIDIGATLERKLRALEAYRSELRPFPHPRSLLAVERLAQWRGATVGCSAAEAFEVGRIIA